MDFVIFNGGRLDESDTMPGTAGGEQITGFAKPQGVVHRYAVNLKYRRARDKL